MNNSKRDFFFQFLFNKITSMGAEITLKRKTQATSPYWNRGRGNKNSYVGRYRYPNYVGKDLALLNIDTLYDPIGNSGKIVYPPTMNGSSYLENKRKETEMHSLFLQEKAKTYYPFRRSYLHIAYSLPDRKVFPTGDQCFQTRNVN